MEGSISFHATFHDIDGRRYLLDIAPPRGYTRDIRRAHGRGTLSYDGTDTEVTFTEVTDRPRPQAPGSDRPRSGQTLTAVIWSPCRKSTADQVVCGVYMSSQSVLHETTNF